jgi:NitT/TauT family transport system substrate-binding protein
MRPREPGTRLGPRLSRRELLGHLAAAGTASFVGSRAWATGAEPPPETTRLRVHHSQSLCLAPQYVAEDLLRGEGFTDVQYVRPRGPAGGYQALTAGEADIANDFAPVVIIRLDRGDPIVILAGVHIGCFELFGTERVRAVRDLKGKTVGVRGLESPPHVFLAIMVAHVGLDPRKDIAWSTHPSEESMQLLARGEIDAFMGFPPEPQRLRVKQIGHVVVNSAVDRPWAQYFCCMTIANREFARKNPVAAKRALRAILKATDLCALEPDRAARTLVDRNITPSYDDAIQTMKDVVYTKWREYQPEDTLRFYALRLHEAGMIKTSPQKIIAQGTDWRFLNELKKELKA